MHVFLQTPFVLQKQTLSFFTNIKIYIETNLIVILLITKSDKNKLIVFLHDYYI